MYIFGFFKALLKPKNFLPALYFLVNAAIIFGLFMLIPYQIVDDGFKNKIYLGLIGLAVNLFFIMISLSPLGEATWRMRNRIKKQPEYNYSSLWQNALAVFEEVKSRAKSVARISNKVTLYYSPTNDLNAYALGHRTVIVTRKMLEVHPEYLKGVLAHELGHIAHGDSDLKLGINVANGILSVFMTVVSMLSYILIGIFFGDKNGRLNGLGILINFLFNVLILGLFRLWTLVGVLCINWTSKKDEYRADGFAKELGYDRQLASFLSTIDGSKTKTSKFDLMFQTHPDTVDRVSALGYSY